MTPYHKKLIFQEKVVDATLGKKIWMGCTKAYCPFTFSFVSGSRCCLIVENYKERAPSEMTTEYTLGS